MGYALNSQAAVIYTVKVIDSDKGAWYKDQQGKTFDCLLDIYNRPFDRGQIVAFKVFGCYRPVKHILPHHCLIIEQRFSNEKEITRYYGK